MAAGSEHPHSKATTCCTHVPRYSLSCAENLRECSATQPRHAVDIERVCRRFQLEDAAGAVLLRLQAGLACLCIPVMLQVHLPLTTSEYGRERVPQCRISRIVALFAPRRAACNYERGAGTYDVVAVRRAHLVRIHLAHPLRQAVNMQLEAHAPSKPLCEHLSWPVVEASQAEPRTPRFVDQPRNR